jgi:hypothetical protein
MHKNQPNMINAPPKTEQISKPLILKGDSCHTDDIIMKPNIQIDENGVNVSMRSMTDVFLNTTEDIS